MCVRWRARTDSRQCGCSGSAPPDMACRLVIDRHYRVFGGEPGAALSTVYGPAGGKPDSHGPDLPLGAVQIPAAGRASAADIAVAADTEDSNGRIQGVDRFVRRVEKGGLPGITRIPNPVSTVSGRRTAARITIWIAWKIWLKLNGWLTKASVTRDGKNHPHEWGHCSLEGHPSSLFQGIGQNEIVEIDGID